VRIIDSGMLPNPERVIFDAPLHEPT
jgi:hypothetical protein